jgi:hypothetical protein
MPWAFSDGFDCYTNSADMALGYWDTCTTAQTFQPGRFAGGRAVAIAGGGPNFVKSSGANDSVHHINIAAYFAQNLGALTQVQNYIQLLDGTTPQCTISFQNNGGIALLSGGTGGAILATFPGALTTVTTWYAFEIEVVVHNSTGRFRVRKNGNSVDDFDSGAVLDTAGGTANNFANKIAFGLVNGSPAMYLDDFYWRSDISSVPWWTDIRCNTRPPASDASVQFSRTTPIPLTIFPGAVAMSVTNNQCRYVPFTPAISGSVSAISLTQHSGTPSTSNMKCAIYATNPGTPPLPAAVIASAVAVVNAGTVGAGGLITFIFSPPVAVTAGVTYAASVAFETSSGFIITQTLANCASFSSGYTAFPASNPGGLSVVNDGIRMIITLAPAANWMVVNEAQQDAAASYVYDTVPGHADFYGIAPLTSTPMQTFAVTTRLLATKSDAGTRTMAAQLKSGGTTVASPTVVLSPSAWQWVWRTDATDPAGGAWTAAAVNAAQIGPLVVA